MLLSTISVLAGLLTAEAPDSIRAVTVVADHATAAPGTDTVQVSNSISVTDALDAIPGICVMDNGGTAGLKTVSLRGLGSPHTAIYLDGVRVSNVQSGQTDLGMFDPSSCGGIVIDYARNSVSFITAKPTFGRRAIGGKARFRGGSFGTYEPSARLDFRLSDKVSLSATAGGILSKGDFPLADGSRRLNNDISQIHTGLDSWGTMSGGEWHAKVYYNGSQRGTPGTLSWPSTDRQKDNNALIQGLVRKQFTPLYSLSASAKASFDDLEYLSGQGNNFYRQTEAQLNSSHKFSVCDWMDASISADVAWDALDSDLYRAARASVFTSASAIFHTQGFTAGISLEYSGTFDIGAQSRGALSPAIDLHWNFFRGFSILAFARRAYRAPTFNELYYPAFGNPDLKPEDAWLTDLGIEYNLTYGGCWRFQAKADGFFNHLKDKIISAPTESDPNIWRPYNIGEAQMAGADVKASVNYIGSPLEAGLSARYCYQNAIDRTPGSDAAGRQIPFIPGHAIVLSADIRYRGWSAELSWRWRGQRYDSAGLMPDYNTLDLTAGKEFRLPKDLALCLKFIARNLTDCRYELAGGYPMPGRSFFGTLEFRF